MRIWPVSHIPWGNIVILSSLSITQNWTNRGAVNQYPITVHSEQREALLHQNFLWPLHVWKMALCCFHSRFSRSFLKFSKWKESTFLSHTSWAKRVALILHTNPHCPMWKVIICGWSNSLFVLTIVCLMGFTGIEILSEFHYLLELV